MNKKGIVIPIGVLILVGLVALGIWLGPSILKLASNGQTAAITNTGYTAPEIEPDSSGVCPIEGYINYNGKCTCVGTDTTTVTLSAKNALDGSASVSGNHLYKINGAKHKTVADSSTFTASPGDVIDILWNTTDYSADTSTETVPCKGTVTYTHDLYQNSSLTLSVWNQEGVLIDGSGTNNETLGVGETITLKGELMGSYLKGLPNGGLCVCEYNSSALDDCILQFGGGDDDVPDFYTVSSTANKAKAYNFPAIISNDAKPVKIFLDADDTENPAAAHSIGIKCYDKNMYANQKKGTFEGPAVENQDGTFISLQKYSYTLYYD